MSAFWDGVRDGAGRPTPDDARRGERDYSSGVVVGAVAQIVSVIFSVIGVITVGSWLVGLFP